jgi:tellurite resistance protein
MALGKDVFRALAAVAWADSEVKPAEKEALLRAARASGLSSADLAEVEHATRQRTTIDDLGALHLTGEDAEYAYALAWMISAADAHVDESEVAVLGKLGDKLGLDQDARDRAAAASFAVSSALGLHGDALSALAKAIESAP